MITRFITLLWQIWKHNAIKYNTTVGKERGGWCLGLKDKTKNVQSAKFLPKVCKEQSISMHNQLTSSQVLTVTVLFVLYHCKCQKSIFTKVMQLIKNKLEKGVLETCQKKYFIIHWQMNWKSQSWKVHSLRLWKSQDERRTVLGNNDLYVSLKTFQASDTSSFHNSSHIFLQFHIAKLAG